MFLFLCFCVIIPCTWGDTVSLLVSDYDGTFANSINNIELNCKMISRFLGFGNHFVLSSGRSYNSLLKRRWLCGIIFLSNISEGFYGKV
jgi:hypothetical protein